MDNIYVFKRFTWTNIQRVQHGVRRAAERAALVHSKCQELDRN